MPTTESIREFVIAAHADFDAVQAMLADDAGLLNASHVWKEDDHESAIMGAAHMGNRTITQFLLGKGAPMAICTAAMLGNFAEVREALRKQPALIRERGAHGISLLAHASHSGDVDLVQHLFEHGATDGANQALSFALNGNHTALSLWLVANARIDKRWKNFQGKTVIDLAVGRGMTEVVNQLTS